MKPIKPTWRKLLLLWVMLAVALPAHAYYDPGVQRWLNRDPIGEGGGVNLFQFVLNSPVNLADRFGLDIFNNPQNYQPDKDHPGEEFGKKCARGLWDMVKDDVEDWAMNDLFHGKVGLCYDNLRECAKDNLGLGLPNLGDKKEGLGSNWPKQKKPQGTGLGLDVDKNGVGVKWRPKPNLDFSAKYDYDGSCKFRGRWSF